MTSEIWLADFIFYYKLTPKEKAEGVTPSVYVVKDVVTKKIPTRFLINEKLSYARATTGFENMVNFTNTLQDDPTTGLKKFTIQFTKKIGEVNE